MRAGLRRSRRGDVYALGALLVLGGGRGERSARAGPPWVGARTRGVVFGRRVMRAPGPYRPEFRARLIDLVRSGQSPESLAKKFEPSAQTIRNWVRQADLDDGRRHDGLPSSEREELTRLRRENRVLREEREILKK